MVIHTRSLNAIIVLPFQNQQSHISAKEAITIAVPDKYLKLENPKRANIMAVMKQTIWEIGQIYLVKANIIADSGCKVYQNNIRSTKNLFV